MTPSPTSSAQRRACRPALLTALAVGWALASAGCAHDDTKPDPAGASAAAAAKEKPTYLWRITSPGAEAPSAWLLGSVHVTLQDSKLDAVLHRAFDEADALAVELDIDEVPARELMEAFGPAEQAEGPDLKTQLGDEDFARLQSLLETSGVLLPDLEHRKPWAVSLVLTFVTPMRGPGAGEELEVGVDRYFIAKAKAKKLAIHSLETVDEQMSALASASPRLQLADLRASMNALEAGVSPARAVVDSYFEGTLDADDLASPADAPDGGDAGLASDRAVYHQRVFTDRNTTMARRIQALLDEGRRPFIVVGAGHLLGDQGIPSLLQEAGYKVEAVPPSGEMIAVQLPKESAAALPTAVVIEEEVPWPSPPRSKQVKVGGGVQTLQMALVPPLRYMLTRSPMPRSLLTNLRLTYEQSIIAQEQQLNAKNTRSEPMMVGDLVGNYIELESEAMWFAIVQVWADGTYYNFAAFAPLKEATAARRAEAEAVLRRFSLTTLTVEEIEARAKAIEAVLAERPSWLHPYEQCPTASMNEAALPPVPKTYPCKDPNQCLKPCQDGDAWLCMELADQLGVYGVAPEVVEPLYARSCRLGFIEGCTSQASAHFLDDEAEALWPCAVESFALGCDKGDPWGCLFLGRAYAAGRGADKQTDAALPYFEQSCVAMGESHPACRAARRTLQALERMKDADQSAAPEPAQPAPDDG